MSKKRPGVEAAKRLLQSSDESLWQRVESQSEYVNVMVSNTPSSVPDLHFLRSKLTKPQKGKGQKNRSTTSSSDDDDSFFLTKEELLKVVEWKFAVGKPRYALMKYLHSNSNAIVQQHTQRALSFANEIPKVTEQNHNHSNDDDNDNNDNDKNLKEAAMNELTQHLKGVGPATASAILTLVRPDVFCYLYDEAIDCFLPKRTYTHKVYETVNQKCTKIAKQLSSSSSSSNTHWTTARVAKTLWVAARICAVGEKEDYTLSVVRKPSNTTKTKNREEEEIQDATSSLLDATNKTNNNANANRKNKRKRRNSP